MTNARTVRPTDIVALVSYDGRVYPNAAVTKDRVGTHASPHPLETALEQWFSFATGRHTWISIKGATLRGLASARRRGSKAAWEVDCLIDAAEDDDSVLTSLLDQVAADASRAGAEKVFLRVQSDSSVVASATRFGFAPYLNEVLLAAEGPIAVRDEDSPHKLRRWTKTDAHATFRLYNHWAPETVRRAEAATLREWQNARERVSPGHGAQQRVVAVDDQVVGWLRTAVDGEVGRFDLMVDADREEVVDALIDAALARFSEQSTLLTLVPLFEPTVIRSLEDRGFEQQEQFTVLARRTTSTVPVPQLAPSAVQSYTT